VPQCVIDELEVFELFDPTRIVPDAVVDVDLAGRIFYRIEHMRRSPSQPTVIMA
jgi:hypothetical protein